MLSNFLVLDYLLQRSRSVVKNHNSSRRWNEKCLNWSSFRNMNANTDENWSVFNHNINA